MSSFTSKPISLAMAVSLLCVFISFIFLLFHIMTSSTPGWLFFWGVSLAWNGLMLYINSSKVGK
jgi:hypothetical protein